MKNKLKQITRKYLTPIIVAGALAFNSNAYAKPNSYQELAENQRVAKQAQKIRQIKNDNTNLKEVESKIKDFQRHKTGLENYVTQRILDKKLSIKENIEIGNYIGDSIGKINEIKSYSIDNNIKLSRSQK